MPRSQREPASSSDDSATRPVRVLLIEDNADAADMLSIVLQAEGFAVRVAANAVEAFALLDRFQPVVALVDVGLPVIDGYELARRIRATTHCGLIGISGREPFLDGPNATCFDAYLKKPVDFAALRNAIVQLANLAAAESC
jgi:DNA-binding response OmpR family regulator